MKKLLLQITLVLLLTLNACYPVHVLAEGNGKGRYQAYPIPNKVYAQDGGLWILDTRTGQVKVCSLDQLLRPQCTGWSPNLPSDYKNE